MNGEWQRRKIKLRTRQQHFLKMWELDRAAAKCFDLYGANLVWNGNAMLEIYITEAAPCLGAKGESLVCRMAGIAARIPTTKSTQMIR